MKFVLDTNVLSAAMSPSPPAPVAAWIAAQAAETLFTSSVCQAEILSGIAILPEGRRRRALEAAAYAVFAEDFEGRILPFDWQAAIAYAAIFADRRRSGRPNISFDLMIAAIARVNDASVVTRDVGGFEGCGVALINPWETT